MGHEERGIQRMLPLESLLLDWTNPRLRPDEQILPPDELPDSDHHQDRLIEILAYKYNPLPIAESIARHQYFLSEPMIAVRHGSRFRVIEGNRRLAALKILANPALRAKISKKKRGWLAIPEGDYGGDYPVVIVDSESTIAPLLGYRHISGIEPWAAYAQARYIAGLLITTESPSTRSPNLSARAPQPFARCIATMI